MKSRNIFTGYSLLPFNFLKVKDDRYFLSNFSGDYYWVSKDILLKLIYHELTPDFEEYEDLKAKFFIMGSDSTIALDLLSAQYRTKKSLLSDFTNLFMVVPTIRCNQKCIYCQASSKDFINNGNIDMTYEIADKAIDFIFKTPSPSIKIEFQGGEPLLNFEIVKYIIEKALAEKKEKAVEFVIATNSTLLSDDIISFCKDKNVFLSISLDGPAEVHNFNRPGILFHDSYQRVTSSIKEAQERLGKDRVSALMTATKVSLNSYKRIIDEYIANGLDSIFLRSINPFGRAPEDEFCNYSIDEWLEFYKNSLDYILELNKKGIRFREEFAAYFIRNLLTPFPTSFVDLQSPAGIGIAGIVINHDGNVYPSDEARMQAEMGDKKFLMGNVTKATYEEIMLSKAYLDPLEESLLECIPECYECAFIHYCGSDPIRHYVIENDYVGYKPASPFCKKIKGILFYLIELLDSDIETRSILRSWI